MPLLMIMIYCSQGVYASPPNFDGSLCEASNQLLTCSGRGFLTADLLYWKAYEGGLNFCGSNKSKDEVKTNGEVVSTIKARRNDPQFQWSPGFRIGMGYAFARNCWDIAAYWTHFRSHAHAKGRNDEQKFRWKLDFEVVDLLIGYEYNIFPCFTLRPFGGMRAARIDQTARTTQFTRSSGSSSSYSAMDWRHQKATLSAIGPLVGIDAGWRLKYGFILYANSAISCLYGDFNVKTQEYERFSHGTNFCYLRQHLHACQAVVDTSLGIRWERCFCNDMQLMIGLGLEQHRYCDHNRIGDYGDLCLQGVTFSAGIEF